MLRRNLDGMLLQLPTALNSFEDDVAKSRAQRASEDGQMCSNTFLSSWLWWKKWTSPDYRMYRKSITAPQGKQISTLSRDGDLVLLLDNASEICASVETKEQPATEMKCTDDTQNRCLQPDRAENAHEKINDAGLLSCNCNSRLSTTNCPLSGAGRSNSVATCRHLPPRLSVRLRRKAWEHSRLFDDDAECSLTGTGSGATTGTRHRADEMECQPYDLFDVGTDVTYLTISEPSLKGQGLLDKCANRLEPRLTTSRPVQDGNCPIRIAPPPPPISVTRRQSSRLVGQCSGWQAKPARPVSMLVEPIQRMHASSTNCGDGVTMVAPVGSRCRDLNGGLLEDMKLLDPIFQIHPQCDNKSADLAQCYQTESQPISSRVQALNSDLLETMGHDIKPNLLNSQANSRPPVPLPANAASSLSVDRDLQQQHHQQQQHHHHHIQLCPPVSQQHQGIRHHQHKHNQRFRKHLASHNPRQQTHSQDIRDQLVTYGWLRHLVAPPPPLFSRREDRRQFLAGESQPNNPVVPRRQQMPHPETRRRDNPAGTGRHKQQPKNSKSVSHQLEQHWSLTWYNFDGHAEGLDSDALVRSVFAVISARLRKDYLSYQRSKHPGERDPQRPIDSSTPCRSWRKPVPTQCPVSSSNQAGGLLRLCIKWNSAESGLNSMLIGHRGGDNCTVGSLHTDVVGQETAKNGRVSKTHVSATLGMDSSPCLVNGILPVANANEELRARQRHREHKKVYSFGGLLVQPCYFSRSLDMNNIDRDLDQVLSDESVACRSSSIASFSSPDNMDLFDSHEKVAGHGLPKRRKRIQRPSSAFPLRHASNTRSVDHSASALQCDHCFPTHCCHDNPVNIRCHCCHCHHHHHHRDCSLIRQPTGNYTWCHCACHQCHRCHVEVERCTGSRRHRCRHGWRRQRRGWLTKWRRRVDTACCQPASVGQVARSSTPQQQHVCSSSSSENVATGGAAAPVDTTTTGPADIQVKQLTAAQIGSKVRQGQTAGAVNGGQLRPQREKHHRRPDSRNDAQPVRNNGRSCLNLPSLPARCSLVHVHLSNDDFAVATETTNCQKQAHKAQKDRERRVLADNERSERQAKNRITLVSNVLSSAWT